METDCAQSRHSPFLLEELIEEILSRLPVMSLAQCRCVSKSWYLLISDPKFIKLHLDRSPKYANLVLTLESLSLENDETENDETDNDDTEVANPDAFVICFPKHSLFCNPPPIVIPEDICTTLNSPYRPTGSCNGIVCFSKNVFNNGIVTKSVLFCNPALRLTSKKSPPLHTSFSDNMGIGSGFGYDSLTDTYKVATLHYVKQHITILVHTMGDDCWRQILSFSAFPILNQRYGKFVRGSLNWLALRKFGSAYNWGDVTVDQLVIFSLDLEKETFKHLCLPDDFDELPFHEPSLAILRDCLCLFHCHRGTHLVIWQMKDIGVEKSWNQLINVSYQHLQFVMDGLYCTPLPLCTSENGDVVLFVSNEESEVILYNWKENTVQHIDIPNNRGLINAMDYVQSLVLPY